MAPSDATYPASRSAGRAAGNCRALTPGREDETLLADAPPHGDSLAARLRAGVSRLLRIMTARADEWETAAETRAREEELAARVWDAMRIAAGLDQTPGGSQPTPSHSPPRAGGTTFDVFAGGLSVHFLGEEGDPPSAAGAYQAPPQQEAGAPAFAPADLDALRLPPESRHFTPLSPEVFAQHIAVKGCVPGGHAPREEAPEAAAEAAPSCPGREASPWIKAGSRQTLRGATQAAAVIEARRTQLHALHTRLQSVGAALMAARRSALEAQPERTVAPVATHLAHLLRTATTRTAAWWQQPGASPSAVPLETETHQPGACEPSGEPPPRAPRGIFYFAVAAILLILAAASLTQVEIVIAGTGEIVSGAPPVTLQPAERAIVREVNVRVGDHVTRGQVLATLEPAPAPADTAPALAEEGVQALVVRKAALKAELRRIEAEVLGTSFEPADPTNSGDILQAALYGRRQMEYASRLRAFDEEISRLGTMMAALKDDRRFLARQLSIANEVEAMHADLQKRSPASKLQVLESQSSRLRYERDHQNITDRLAELRHSAKAARVQRQAFIDAWRKRLLEDLVTKRHELDQLNIRLARTARSDAPVRLKAPVDGVVLGVAPRPAGAVVHEAEPLVTLAPSDAPLIAEILVESPDVGYASPGDRVLIRMDAFPIQQRGPMEGRLLSIREAPFAPRQQATSASVTAGTPSRPAQGAVHRARIALTGARPETLPKGARLVPGMSLSAEIQAGRRSVMSYFLSPLTRGFGERERAM